MSRFNVFDDEDEEENKDSGIKQELTVNKSNTNTNSFAFSPLTHIIKNIDDEIDDKYYKPMKNKKKKKQEQEKEQYYSKNNNNNNNYNNNYDNYKQPTIKERNIDFENTKKEDFLTNNINNNVVVVQNVIFDVDMLLNSIEKVKIYFFHIKNNNWNDINNFQNVYDIDVWNDIPEIFNSFYSLKTKINNYNLFFMKNKISPLWESKENRGAGRINIQIYDLNETLHFLKILLINNSNKTLLMPKNYSKTDINGFALLPKIDTKENKSYQIIQIWFSNNIIRNISKNHEMILNTHITDLLSTKKYSVRVKIHKQQY